jgi:phage terminase small subunit
MPLTERQRRFAETYIDGPLGVALNATRSAEAAGYAWPSRQGPRLLTFPAVAAAIKPRWRAMLRRAKDA